VIRNNILAVDAAIAVVIAATILIISPGLAVTGLVALAAFVVLGVSFAWTHLRRR
jgi:ABC-type bacteriocin/lantibiotic exporter with double-glycine peptidase domain